MADLTGKNIKDTYKRLVQLTGTGQVELSSTAGSAVYLTDGAGNSSVLSLSQSRMGLGTTSPSDLLHLYDGSGSSGIRLESQLPSLLLIDNNSPTGGAGTFKIQADGTDDSNVGAFIIEDLNASLVSQGKPFIIQTGADTNSLYIQADNKVGIGTSTPAKLLDVAGDIGLSGDIYLAQAKKIYFDSTDTYIYADATSDEKLIIGSDSDIVLEPDVKLDIDTGTIDLSTQTVDVTLNAAVDALNFDSNTLSIDASNNRVGIGTASPDYHLDIEGTASQVLRVHSTEGHSYLILASDSDEGQASIIQFASGTDVRGKIDFEHNTTAASQLMKFQIGDNLVTAMSIKGNGYVGIGTNTPAAPLETYRADTGNHIVFDRAGTDIGNIEIASTRLSINGPANGSIVINQEANDVDFNVKPDSGEGLFVQGSSGNVGIGTTSPASSLDIEDNVDGDFVAIQVTNTHSTDDTDDSVSIRFSPDNAQLNSARIRVGKDEDYSTGANNSAHMAFHTTKDNGSHERMRISAAGNVGIGTTDPNYLLHVNHPTGAAEIFLSRDDDATTDGAFLGTLSFGADDPVDGTFNRGASIHAEAGDDWGSNDYASDIVFKVAGNSGAVAEHMRLIHDGRFAIGTNSASCKLTVQTDETTAHVLNLRNMPTSGSGNSDGDVTTILWSHADSDSPYGGYSPVALGTKITSASDRKADFFIAVADSDNVDVSTDIRFLIDEGGNVGVGTEAPAYLLDVEGTVTSNYIAKFHNTGNNSNLYGIAIESGLTTANTDTRWVALAENGGTVKSFIKHITSGKHADFVSASDERLKKNIADTDEKGLDVINALKWRKFDWDEDKVKAAGAGGTGHDKMWLIAQEVEKIVPEAVTTNIDNNMKELGDSWIIKYAAKAIQELSARLTALENK